MAHSRVPQWRRLSVEKRNLSEVFHGVWSRLSRRMQPGIVRRFFYTHSHFPPFFSSGLNWPRPGACACPFVRGALWVIGVVTQERPHGPLSSLKRNDWYWKGAGKARENLRNRSAQLFRKGWWNWRLQNFHFFSRIKFFIPFIFLLKNINKILFSYQIKEKSHPKNYRLRTNTINSDWGKNTQLDGGGFPYEIPRHVTDVLIMKAVINWSAVLVGKWARSKNRDVAGKRGGWISVDAKFPREFSIESFSRSFEKRRNFLFFSYYLQKFFEIVFMLFLYVDFRMRFLCEV